MSLQLLHASGQLIALGAESFDVLLALGLMLLETGKLLVQARFLGV